MTYNIRGALGMDGQRSIARIADVISSQNPDIVCLQEVHQRLLWSGLSDQPRQLQRRLGMPMTFYSTVNFGIGGFGLGIATRLPILRVKKHALPSLREKRGALEIQVGWGGETRNIICTHWGLNQDERMRQANRIAELVRNAEPKQTIVCGDFNERPSASAIGTLLAASRLIDVGSIHDAPTYPSNLPEARIDFILCSPEMRFEAVKVIPTEASDHLPLVVDFL